VLANVLEDKELKYIIGGGPFLRDFLLVIEVCSSLNYTKEEILEELNYKLEDLLEIAEDNNSYKSFVKIDYVTAVRKLNIN